ncbi:YihY/virulence factor BrkB family protein [Trujillonella endophytica]|nr:YihY/virulence factor BrkB family protein [Trujillella endophytica]
MAESSGGAPPPPPPSRAREVSGPHRLSAREWRRVLRRTARHVLGDRLQVLSAGISFFAILSIAPVLVTALSVYGALNTPEQALAQLSDLARTLPDDLEPIVEDQLTTITTASGEVLTWQGISGLLVALWTATTAATFLVDALTLAYSETETRGLLRRSGIGLALVVGIALLVGAVIAAGGLASRAVDGAPDAVRTAWRLLVWPGLAAVMACGLAVLYRYAPDRHDARWRWITPGAGLATLLWLASSMILFAYVQSLGNYEATYGSLAGVAISMFWLWLSVFLVIVGAAVNAEAERETLRDTTVGPERPMGERGAVVADSTPP